MVGGFCSYRDNRINFWKMKKDLPTTYPSDFLLIQKRSQCSELKSRSLADVFCSFFISDGVLCFILFRQFSHSSKNER